MKSISAELAQFFRGGARQNLKVLVYATVFRYLMWRRGGNSPSSPASTG